MVTDNGRNSGSPADGTRTVNNNSVRASGSQQLVAAPCWTPPLLGQLKRDKWEGLCYLRGLSVPLRREDVYALLMGSEQGINVYSETESALYREAYEKLYGEAPPVDPTGSIGQRDAMMSLDEASLIETR
ncbi:hypothetical protein FOZ60_006742 [Perkinsus olseni]|uniref:Uncharacterized protein n=1 Tax=Perkinsus olseni TaxID=32597 RepID=A0A7J6NN78_PEROL|nr:hypothetical protein FOZ60_006742 [Perkinsus olseni]